MEQIQADLLTESFLEINNKRRKDLIPWWIKIFCWLFLVLGALAPIGLIFGILGYNFDLSLYGFQTNDPMSLTGIIIILLFVFKAITAFSLLKEKDQAVTMGIADASLGILVCIFIMIYPFIFFESSAILTFRLELVFLIPYLIKMVKIKADWEKSIHI